MITSDRLSLIALLADLRQRLEWREELLSLTLIAAESAIVYLYLGALLPSRLPPYDPMPGLLIFGLLAAGYFLPHLLDEARVWSPEYELILGVGMGLSLLVALKVAAFPQAPWLSLGWLGDAVDGLIIRPTAALRPVWGVVGLLIYTWWRGKTRAEPVVETAYGMLRWGTLAIAGALLLLLVTTTGAAPIRDRMPGAVVIYVAAALAAVGIARFRLEGMRSGTPLGPNWLATFAAPIAVVLTLAIVAAGIFSRRFLETVLMVLGPLIWVVGLLLRAIIILIALIAFVIITPILWLLERQGFGQFRLSGRLPQVTSPLAQFENFARDTLHVSDPVRYLVAGAILVLIGTALARYVYRRRRRWRESAEEHRESVFRWDEAMGGLLTRLRGLVRPIASRSDPLARLRGDPRWAHTVFIRETYIRLLQHGARAGRPRAPAATPTEHEPGLAGQFPAAGAEIATITDAYEAARYGREPATPEAAAAVRRAWERFQERGER